MRTNTLLLALAATGTLAIANFALAQETPAQTGTITVPAPDSAASTPTSPATSTPTLPTRGSTMESVKAKFGAPLQEEPAVGTPPITRWDYAGYSVFFENDKVLHSVVKAT
jgi:hypothetical protein